MNFAQPRSLQTRQLMAVSLGLVAFLALAGYALDRAFIEAAKTRLQERLASYALSFARESDFARDGSFVEAYDPPDARFNRPGSGLYAEVVYPNGHWDSESAQGPMLPDGEMLPAKSTRFEGPLAIREIDGSRGEVYRYGMGLIWSSSNGAAGEIPYTIYIYESTTALSEQVLVFRAALWRYLGGAGLILLLLQGVIMRWSLLPMRDVIAELKQVQRGEKPRMSERHPRELEPLTESINAFIESERENLDRQRNTLADLAHSLKTPLAVLHSRLEDPTADEAALREEVGAQVRRMNDIVSYQLARAAKSGHALFSAPIAIEPHAEQIVKGLEKLYAAKGVFCEFEIEPDMQFFGEPGDLQELLGNLLENAFKWAHSRVLLTLRPLPCDGGRRPGLLLAVDDDGPGIPPDKVATVLQRGVRGDERVHGHGIGLSIVQDLVRAYRGTLEVSASSELGGARFEVELPPGL
jgi:two-component system sensor histidine kinase PhoQ